jgi:hypothetical protein
MTPESKRGGRRPGAGRPKGRRNIATLAQKASITELAQQYMLEAIETVVGIMRNSEERASVRLTAAGMLLDRGYGRTWQGVAVDHQQRIDVTNQFAGTPLFLPSCPRKRGSHY